MKKRNIKSSLKTSSNGLKNEILFLEKKEINLYEMKKIAAYARDEELTPFELERLNVELNELKSEIQLLEKQLNDNVH